MIRLTAALLAAVTALTAGGDFKFEVLSIKPLQAGSSLSLNTAPSPNGYVARLSIWQMIQLAYAPDYTGSSGYAEILNGPSWSGDFYDINARVSNGDIKTWQSQGSKHELLRSAMRAALQERCKLAIHEQPAMQPNFEMVVDKRGPRLKSPTSASLLPSGAKLASGGVMVGSQVNGRTVWHYYGATMGDLVAFLNDLSHGMPVRDKTNLTGRYDFTLEQTEQLSPGEEAVYRFPIDPLGLTLRRGMESRPKLVIDHIEKPSAN